MLREDTRRPGGPRPAWPSSPAFAVWVLLGLIPIFALGAYAYRVAATTAQRLIDSGNLAGANVTRDLVKQEFENLATATGIFAEIRAVQDAVRQRDEDDLRRSLQVLVDASPEIVRAFVTDTGGRLWSDFPRAPESLGQTFSDRDWYKGVARSWKPYVSHVYQRNASPRILLVAFAAPIRDPSSHEVIGILVSQVSLETLAELLGRVQVGQGGHVLLVDPDGALAAHPQIDLQSGIHGEYATSLPVAAALAGRTWSMRYVDPISREEMLAAALPVEILGDTWAVVAQQPLRAAYGSTRLLALQIGGAGILVTAIVLGLGLALYQSLRRISLFMAQDRASAEAKFHDLFSFAPEAILLVDTDGRIIDVNPQGERTFGYGCEELIGQGVERLIPGPSRDGHAKLRADYFRNPVYLPMSARNSNIMGRRKDGTTFRAEISLIPLISGSKTVVAASVQDFSEKLAIESQLRQAQKMEATGQLTGGLAHDFNNLLMIIIGNLDLLAERLETDARAQKLVQTALSASLRGADLTRKLLAFSRKQSLEATAVDVNDLVRGMTEMLRRSLGENIEIEMSTAENLWPVDTDPAQLESAVVNFAINARDAMPNGGRLTIETANRHLDDHYAAQNPDVTPGDYVMLAVTDTGTGIPPEQLERVMEPFFTTKEAGKGSGLGLSMVYGFAKQSGGHLKIYSEVGHGTTVRLYLPRGKTRPEMAPGPAAQTGEPAATGQLILVVDDNASVRSTVVAQLGQIGYRTLEAADGASAVALLEATPGIDLLLTDIVMPGGMNGVQLGEAAKRIRPDLRILYTSGFTEASVRGATANAIASQQLLSKPYRKQELARKVREALSAG